MKLRKILKYIDIDFYKNFIPNPHFKNSIGINRNVRVVTTMGPFKPQKNLKDFIKAASITIEILKNVVFLIVGDGEQRKELENLIENLNLKDKVILYKLENGYCRNT
ncbi:MAG: glycosyltransferase [Bacteroidales bacterium]|nr:glycosyltransferase [Bacteroidales bacterium]